MAKRKRKRNKAAALVGRAGPHQEVSPMGHATRTKSKAERLRQADRREKRRGWVDG